ncbi:STAS-like domain-containing protein [Pseudomonas sp. FP1154]|uniref:STAS-like domain-containing protein n=1 Tax=Pseudomonas sp. FP1154 TaxID=2954077 RepID=UPI002734C0B7|nr:STAS-like domain-containing protein [Pseudomonas sp. FP1154]WLG23871.1 STAS-like domain-containing protein [Pseudomonas sp. FP1154]
MKSMRDQLYGIKRKFKKDSKVTLVLPSEFTFNRSEIKHFDHVLSVFNWNLRNIPVEIDFRSCSSANYQAVSLLILYCWRLKQQGCTVSVLLDNEDDPNGSRVWRMLGAQGLFAVCTNPQINFNSNEHKPLFAIRNSDDFKAALKSLDDFTLNFGVEYQKTLRYVISELLYNVHEHGISDFHWRGKRYPTPSLLQFTWYEKVNELHFIVGDIGIGVKNHISKAYPGISTDEEAIRLAIQPEISGTFTTKDPYATRNNAGMGLFISSNILKKLRGDMHIISGNGAVHISPTDTTAKTLDANWPGTFVLVTVRLDRGTEIALDAMMSEFRDHAKAEIAARTNAATMQQLYVGMYNYFGKNADLKSEAINYRDKHIIPALSEGKSLLLDFVDVDSSTHSFLNALLATPIRRMGLIAYKKIRIVNATKEIRETIDYILDDNTGDVAPSDQEE